MARGQYDLTLNSARPPPTYGPSRPPPLEASRPATSRAPSSEGPASPPNRPTVLVLSSSGPPISKGQLVALRAKVDREATILVVDTADASIAALSRSPSAVIVLDNAMTLPTFALARAELLRYAQNGGRLITDLAQSSMPGSAAEYAATCSSDRHVEYNVKNRMSDLRADHLVS